MSDQTFKAVRVVDDGGVLVHQEVAVITCPEELSVHGLPGDLHLLQKAHQKANLPSCQASCDVVPLLRIVVAPTVGRYACYISHIGSP
jgi:hypothetical protein